VELSIGTHHWKLPWTTYHGSSVRDSKPRQSLQLRWRWWRLLVYNCVPFFNYWHVFLITVTPYIILVSLFRNFAMMSRIYRFSLLCNIKTCIPSCGSKVFYFHKICSFVWIVTGYANRHGRMYRMFLLLWHHHGRFSMVLHQ